MLEKLVSAHINKCYNLEADLQSPYRTILVERSL